MGGLQLNDSELLKEKRSMSEGDGESEDNENEDFFDPDGKY